ncbi:MAG: T9SS type A sorting domain-containing protein, partial [Ginsengibacter sp.]
SLITCDDDGNPETTPSTLHSRISLSGRAPGEIIYVRVLGKFTNNSGPFAICAWDHSVLPPVSPGGNCIAADNVSINTANLNRYMWVPLFDALGNIMAEINADGNSLNTTNSFLYANTTGTVRNTNGKYYLDRNISIEPSNNGSARVRMYFANNEFTALQAADPSVISINSLNVTKTNITCQPAFSGTASVIVPDAYSDYGTDHYVEFSTPSFSSFYLNSANVTLPLRFISFNAINKNSGVELTWKVTKDNSIKDFEITYSYDGNNFNSIGLVNQNEFEVEENDSRTYRYSHNVQHEGYIFYRIKMNDVNRKNIYSDIIKITVENHRNNIFSIYPNPARNKIFVKTQIRRWNISAALFNSIGQKVKDFGLLRLQNGVFFNVKDLHPGIYFLQIADAAENEVYYEKIVKL